MGSLAGGTAAGGQLCRGSEREARWIWMCSDHRGWCKVGLLRESSDSEAEEVNGECHNSNESEPRLGYFNKAKPQTLEETQI